MNFSYRSINNMNDCILRNLNKFPHDVDLIVGIPRSGMLPANLLALYLNKPYTDINSFLEGRIYECGDRGNVKSPIQKILIIDDSFGTGKAYWKTKSRLEKKIKAQQYKFFFGAIYTSSAGKDILDLWCEVINGPRVFQWNLFHHDILKKSCFDIDGVLCPNPPVDDDGPQYLNYIKNAPPLYTPMVKIDTLVSCRLEKYRVETETWLKKHNIKYKKLIMLNLQSKEERIKWGKHGEYKAKIYKKTSNDLFVESSLAEARIIKKIACKDVFCTETFEMLNADHFSEKTVNFINKITQHLINLFR